MPDAAATQDWFIAEFTGRLSSAIEMMTGEKAEIRSQPAGTSAEGALLWQQPFSDGPGAVWLRSAEPDYAAIGAHILRAAGVDDADGETTKSTYLETLSQALSGLGQALSGKLKREVTPTGGQERDAAQSGAAPAQWFRIEIVLPEQLAAIYIGFDSALLERLAGNEAGEGRKTPAAESSTAVMPQPSTSRTFEILLDVELPVSVSFGRAQVQLKDVLKLTTGSIAELNRSIAEPVEVIVNKCVIARGEVVVVEGNFGVRIQQVISRQERLRTLH